MKNDNLLDKFTEVMAKSLLAVSEEPGFDIWPMPHFHPLEGNFYLYAPENSFLIKLYYLIEKLRDKGLKDQDIAMLFKKPSRIATLTFLFEGIRQSKLTKKERVKLAIDLLNFITFFRKRDPFCEKMENILWTNDEVQTNLKKVNLIFLSNLSKDESKRIRKLVGQINANLLLLCEYLYFNHHFIGHEFHGPYKLGNDFLLVVREYYDLKNEIWEFSRELPTDQITSFEIYEKDVKIGFDFFNRVRSASSLPSKLVAVRFKEGGIEGKELNEDDMKILSSSLLQVSRNAYDFISKLTRKELLEKYVETKYYILKPLAEKLGEDWRPPKEIYDFVKNVPPPEALKEALKEFLGKFSREKQIEMFKLMFDPRVDKLPFG